MSMPDDCPLCDEPAKRSRPVDSLDAYVFDCHTCGSLLTTRGVAVRRGTLAPTERDRLRAKARATQRPGWVFDMTLEDHVARDAVVRRVADWRAPVAAAVPNAADCPRCSMRADLDLAKWPPEARDDMLVVAYACPNGHRFTIDHRLK